MNNEIYKLFIYNVNYICIMFLPRLNVAISDGRTGQSNLLDTSISSIILFPSILEVIGEIMEVEWKVCRCSAPWGGEWNVFIITSTTAFLLTVKDQVLTLEMLNWFRIKIYCVISFEFENIFLFFCLLCPALMCTNLASVVL